MSAITTNQGDIIHYEKFGRGRPVVLVHTWLGSWRYWIQVVNILSAKYTCYAIDLYGFGDSAKNERHYTFEHQIALLEDFMTTLGITKAAMIGHGLGAMVVTEYARRHPEIVPRMMLVSAPLFDPGDLTTRVPVGRSLLSNRPAPAEQFENVPNAATLPSASSAMRAALMAAAKARGGLAPELEQMAANAAAVSMAPPPVFNPLRGIFYGQTGETLLAQCFRRIDERLKDLTVDVPRIDTRVIARMVDTFDAGRLLDTLRLLTVPILLVHGADDPLISQPNEDVLHYITVDKEQTLVPLLLPGVRHFPMLEDDRFAPMVNDFLDAPDIGKIAPKERWRRRTR